MTHEIHLTSSAKKNTSSAKMLISFVLNLSAEAKSVYRFQPSEEACL